MKRAHRRAHRTSWLGLLILLPVILITALVLRQSPSDAPPPEKLGASAQDGGSQ